MKLTKKPSYLKNVVTIDPGSNTAVAYWTGTKYPRVDCFKAYGNDENERYLSIWKKVDDFLMVVKPSRVVMEDSWFSAENINSLTSARRGNLKKLVTITGGIMHIVLSRSIDLDLILPIRWKGNMNDKDVHRRIQLIYGRYEHNIHICCAVGIGLNEVDRFKKIV